MKKRSTLEHLKKNLNYISILGNVININKIYIMLTNNIIYIYILIQLQNIEKKPNKI